MDKRLVQVGIMSRAELRDYKIELEMGILRKRCLWGSCDSLERGELQSSAEQREAVAPVIISRQSCV